MKLLLTSAGLRNKSIVDSLQELVEKPFNQLNFVFVPTAANVEPGEKDWLVEDINNSFKLGWKQFDIVDFSAIEKNVWLPRLKEADVILFGGGSSEYLIECMEKSGLKQILPDLLKNKIYIGVSAGSMICAPKISLSEERILYYEQTKSLEPVEGLGIIPFEIRPHLNSPAFEKVRIDNLQNIADKEKDIAFYAIDDNTAIKVVDGNIEVVSEGDWKKFN